ncbi:MAG TPA: hypothetical protein VFZ48_03870 [Candidatus Saccharimonadales bacterium]
MSKTHVITVTPMLASCDCGETSAGTAFAPESWARLLHANRHTSIYVEVTIDPKNPRVEAMVLEGAYGDSVEGWRIEVGDGLPVLFNAAGERLETMMLGTNWRGGKTIMSLRVPRPNAPKVEIVTRQ